MSETPKYSVYARDDRSLIARAQVFPIPGLSLHMRRDPEALCENVCPPQLVGKLYLLEVVSRPSLSAYQVYGEVSYGEPDFEAGTVAANYSAVAIPLADRRSQMLAAAKARYAVVADGGTSLTVSPGVTVAVATEAKPVLKLTRALAYMTAEALSSMNVVTTAGAPVALTPALATAMLSAVDAHVAACEATHNALVAAITDNEADDAALDLVSIEAGTVDGAGGWPT